MPSYRANPTNKEQDVIDEATHEGGSAVFTGDGNTRVVTKGAPHAAPQKTANSGSTIRNNAGVIMPHDDTPGRMVEETQGKS
jgi:hypothetical protein